MHDSGQDHLRFQVILAYQIALELGVVSIPNGAPADDSGFRDCQSDVISLNGSCLEGIGMFV